MNAYLVGKSLSSANTALLGEMQPPKAVAVASISSFDDFYRQHYGRLTGALRLACNDPGSAEELAQDAFLKAFTKWSHVQEHPNPEGWLFVTGINLARRRWRLHGRRMHLNLDEQRVGIQDEPTTDNAELLAALRRLPKTQRTAVIARHVLGYSGEEAAQLLGMSPGSFRVTLHRAVSSLRLDPAFLSSTSDKDQ